MNAVSKIERESEPLDRRLDSLLRIRDVQRRTGLSVATIYRREAEGTFPRRQRLGPRSVAWYESDINAFVASPSTFRAFELEASRNGTRPEAGSP